MKKISLMIMMLALLTACATKETARINVVPYPNEVRLTGGTFDAAGADFHIDAAIDPQAKGVIEAFAK